MAARPAFRRVGIAACTSFPPSGYSVACSDAARSSLLPRSLSIALKIRVDPNLLFRVEPRRAVGRWPADIQHPAHEIDRRPIGGIHEALTGLRPEELDRRVQIALGEPAAVGIEVGLPEGLFVVDRRTILLGILGPRQHESR